MLFVSVQSVGRMFVCALHVREMRGIAIRNGSLRFRWLKVEKKCCVLFCDSGDIKACKHGLT